MAISLSDNDPRVRYTATSGQTVFAVPFEFFDNDDFDVFEEDTSGSVSQKTLTTDYTVTGGSGSTGSITFGTGITLNHIITIVRNIDIERVTDFTGGAAINRAALNEQLDKLTAITSDIKDVTTRTLRLADWDSDATLTFPNVATRAGKIFGFDSSGNLSVGGGSDFDIILDDVEVDTFTISYSGTPGEGNFFRVNADANSKLVSENGILELQSNKGSGVGKILLDGNASPYVVDITATGGSTRLVSGDVLVDSSGDITLDADGGEIYFKDGGTDKFTFRISAAGNRILADSATTIETSAGAIDIKSALGTVDFLTNSGAQSIQLQSTTTPEIRFYQDSNTLDVNVATLTGTRTLTLPDATDTLVGRATTDTLTNKTLTNPTVTDLVLNNNITGSAVLDQDDMSSNSATKLATQQSIKAYVDSQVASVPQGDITGVVAGTGLTGGGLSGTVTLNINATTGLTATSSTLSIDSTVTTLTGTQTLTNKTLTAPIINTGVSGTAVKDEDDMVSNSSSHLATQQSIKAYVDAQVAGGGAGNLSTVLGIGNTTAGNNIVFGDSSGASDDRLVFGAGSDLQIYHDGSNSLITDTGTGNLTLTGSSEVTIENVARSQYMLRATDGGDVKLFHNGSEKIATTSTGIDVTGTVTADGLTVDSSSSVVATIGSSGSSAARLYFDNTGMTTAGDTQLLSQNNDLAFNTNGSEAMRIDSSGSVGIGTSSPSSYFSGATDLVLSGSGDSGLTIACSAAGRIHFADGTSGDTQYRGYIVYAHGNDSLQIATAATERMRIDSSGNVGIQTTNPAASLHVAESSSGLTARFSNQANQTLDIGTVSGVGAAGSVYIDNANSGNIQFRVGGSEKMRIDSNGDVLIGTTDANLFNETSGGETGHHFRNDGRIYNTTDSNTNIIFNRCGTDGPYIQFRKNGSSTAMGVIESRGGVATNVILRTATNQGAGIGGANSGVLPCDENGLQDNEIDLGSSGTRWDDVYATNGTIQTSDEREKQQIASLTDAEMTAAKAISKLFKTFKWNDKVEAKGDAARTHAGVIAQQVETAMSDAGLDAGKYAFFISTTWWQVDGGEAYDTQEEAPEGATERNRKGIRYPELLSFIGAATEQRLTSIESRLDALEAN